MSHGENSKVCHHGRDRMVPVEATSKAILSSIGNVILCEQLKFTLETMSPLCVSHLFVSDCALDKKVAR